MRYLRCDAPSWSQTGSLGKQAPPGAVQTRRYGNPGPRRSRTGPGPGSSGSSVALFRVITIRSSRARAAAASRTGCMSGRQSPVSGRNARATSDGQMEADAARWPSRSMMAAAISIAARCVGARDGRAEVI